MDHVESVRKRKWLDRTIYVVRVLLKILNVLFNTLLGLLVLLLFDLLVSYLRYQIRNVYLALYVVFQVDSVDFHCCCFKKELDEKGRVFCSCVTWSET